MPSTCTFAFDHPDAVYHSGETVNGSVTLNTLKEKDVRAIYIVFEGFAKVRWEEYRTETRNGKSEDYTVVYTANESYLHTQTRVFGNGKLPPGEHKYTFSIALPINCPTSCTEGYGKIGYEVTLKFEDGYPFENDFTYPLSVIKPLDLNQNPEYLLPIQAEDIKYFCCWPCSSGPVTLTLTIPHSGWAPGQQIAYKLEIDNQSSGYDLSGTTFELKQTYHFTADSPETKTCTNEITLATLDEEDCTVLRLTKRIFEGKMRIPPVPPTFMDDGIIRVSYNIYLDTHMGDCHIDSHIEAPITIGTIPLLQTRTPPVHLIPTAPPLDTLFYSDRPPSYDSCLPPTFEEATHIQTKFKDIDKGDFYNESMDAWLPKYPMYTNTWVNPAAVSPNPPPPESNGGGT